VRAQPRSHGLPSMSKRKRREIRERKQRELLKRWLPDRKKLKALFITNWLALSGIVVPVLAGFVFYYMTVAQPDIRFVTEGDIEIADTQKKENTETSLERLSIRFKNLSFRAGYIDRVEFVPTSVSSYTIKVLEVQKVSIGWGEQKEIWVTYTATYHPEEILTEKAKSGEELAFEVRAYDNTGKLIRDMSGAVGSHRLKIGFTFR
jgi:hypothetical protein